MTNAGWVFLGLLAAAGGLYLYLRHKYRKKTPKEILEEINKHR